MLLFLLILVQTLISSIVLRFNLCIWNLILLYVINQFFWLWNINYLWIYVVNINPLDLIFN